MNRINTVEEIVEILQSKGGTVSTFKVNKDNTFKFIEELTSRGYEAELMMSCDSETDMIVVTEGKA